MELSAQEAEVLGAFRVTGFFGKTPKQNVSRASHQVWRWLETNGTSLSMDDMAAALNGLADKGLISREEGKDVLKLTDAGYQQVCATG